MRRKGGGTRCFFLGVCVLAPPSHVPSPLSLSFPGAAGVGAQTGEKSCPTVVLRELRERERQWGDGGTRQKTPTETLFFNSIHQVAAAPAWAAAGVQLRMIALGTPANAATLATLTRAPPGTLYADPTAATHDALGFSEGYNPRLPFKVSPYARLVAMLAGVGSPGTMREVARGYVGDKTAPQIFASGPFDILGTGYQRPMELATVRLGSMITSLTRWSELAPPDTELLTRLGGAIVLRGRATVFRHDDQGILRVADVGDLARAAGVEAALPA